MSIDRAVMLPHDFDKKEDNPPVDSTDIGAVEVLRSPTKNTMEQSQGSGEHAREEMIEKF